MFDKICSFLGFNTSNSYIGLSQLNGNNIIAEKKTVHQEKKSLKLSDLMRGN